MTKKIKDPIYGYIIIDDEYLKVINSIYFQRLRNIIQTSYTSIYPSALHNRFTHSLGVYWLGNMAFESLIKNSNEIVRNLKDSDIDETRHTFILACLCHDLGHSPFSHTGEKFYKIEEINKQLICAIKNQAYSDALKNGEKIVGKQHEIMSALLAIEKFGDIIEKENFSLFARCITGFQYDDSSELSGKEKNRLLLYRACIELLNSNVIDVDKLDYLIRDSYMSGYSSIVIDYQRLLGGIFINAGVHPIGYEKSSLSVLESVLTAHDMERRWIQSHPIVQYEGYLLKTIIREINGEYNTENNSVFSVDALTENGVELKDIGIVRLLSDADILYLAKRNYEKSDAVKEYCDRSLRRHPIWKSEAEFSLLFDFRRSKTFIEIIKKWEEKLIEGTYGVYSLNDKFYDALKKELEQLNDKMKTLNKGTSQRTTLEIKVSKLEIEMKILDEIKTYLCKHEIPFDIVIVTQQQFKSNIYKEDFRELPIRFDSVSDQTIPMQEATFIPLDTQKDNLFFYMYYKRNSESMNLDVLEFSKMLRRASIV